MKTPTNIPSTLCFRASPFIACLWKLTQQQVWKSVSISKSNSVGYLSVVQNQVSTLFLFCSPKISVASLLFHLLPHFMNKYFASYIYNSDFTIWYLHLFDALSFTIQIWSFDIYIYLLFNYLPSRFDQSVSVAISCVLSIIPTKNYILGTQCNSNVSFNFYWWHQKRYLEQRAGGMFHVSQMKDSSTGCA